VQVAGCRPKPSTASDPIGNALLVTTCHARACARFECRVVRSTCSLIEMARPIVPSCGARSPVIATEDERDSQIDRSMKERWSTPLVKSPALQAASCPPPTDTRHRSPGKPTGCHETASELTTPRRLTREAAAAPLAT